LNKLSIDGKDLSPRYQRIDRIENARDNFDAEKNSEFAWTQVDVLEISGPLPEDFTLVTDVTIKPEVCALISLQIPDAGVKASCLGHATFRLTRFLTRKTRSSAGSTSLQASDAPCAQRTMRSDSLNARASWLCGGRTEQHPILLGGGSAAVAAGVYCSECEAEGFRRITPFLDRPDVMARSRPAPHTLVRRAAAAGSQRAVARPRPQGRRTVRAAG
jgi:hypothetical protein